MVLEPAQQGVGCNEVCPDVLDLLPTGGMAVEASAEPSHQVPVDEAAQGSLVLAQQVLVDDLVHVALEPDQILVAMLQGSDRDQHGAEVVEGLGLRHGVERGVRDRGVLAHHCRDRGLDIRLAQPGRCVGGPVDLDEVLAQPVKFGRGATVRRRESLAEPRIEAASSATLGAELPGG